MKIYIVLSGEFEISRTKKVAHQVIHPFKRDKPYDSNPEQIQKFLHQTEPGTSRIPKIGNEIETAEGPHASNTLNLKAKLNQRRDGNKRYAQHGS